MIHTDFPDKSKRALVLVSGGMDSRVCLQKAVHDLGDGNVVAVCTYYGQKHDKEIKFARQAAGSMLVEFYEVDLSNIFSFNKNCSALLRGSDKEIDHSSYEEQMREKVEAGQAPISNAYVPFRNGLFLSYATALALQFNCDYIVYGAHSDDSNVMIETKDGQKMKCQAYPDCTSQFIEAMSEAIKQGTGSTVELVAPIYNLTKSEVAKLGAKLGMTKEDFKHTWSCYEGGEKECGKCGTCLDKIKALQSIGFTDQDLSTMFSLSTKETEPLQSEPVQEEQPLDYVGIGDIVAFYEEWKGKKVRCTMLVKSYDYGNGDVRVSEEHPYGASAPRCLWGYHCTGTWYGDWASSASTFYKATEKEKQILMDNIPPDIRGKALNLIKNGN